MSALFVRYAPAGIALVLALTAWIRAEAALTMSKIHEQAHAVAASWTPHLGPAPNVGRKQ